MRARVDYLADVYAERECGPADARRQALAAYAAYTGWLQLRSTAPEVLPEVADHGTSGTAARTSPSSSCTERSDRARHDGPRANPAYYERGRTAAIRSVGLQSVSLTGLQKGRHAWSCAPLPLPPLTMEVARPLSRRHRPSGTPPSAGSHTTRRRSRASPVP